jgi:hypothetical protein
MHRYGFGVWDWLVMALEMTAWIVLFGVVVYLAVRFAAHQRVPACSRGTRPHATVEGDRS